MKILVALHQVMDLGGIINHTEQLIGGLKELGHEVHLKEIIWAGASHDNRKSGDWKMGPSGIPHDQGKGWNFKAKDRLHYRGEGHAVGAVQILSRYDMIIWTVPVPGRGQGNMSNCHWPMLYDLPKHIKQIAFIHDGNAARNYPYLMHIEHHLSGIACVHPCALNSSSFLKTPRAMIFNPQEKPVREVALWNEKRPGFVNMQTFKAWKHAHELIEAIAYMPQIQANELREIAGRGIEYQYMTSEDKCKPQYFHADGLESFAGEKFWDTALRNGMTHHDYWTSDEVEHYLTLARILVDPSWSNRYSVDGGHFNRVMVEGMIHGAVTIGREKGVGREVFRAGEHYVAIPEDADAQQYADIVLEVGNMPSQQANHYREASLEVLPYFERKFVAQQVIDLAFGDLKPTTTSDAESVDKALVKKSEDILFHHFGIIA